MKKIITAFAALLFCQIPFAQNSTDLLTPGNFVIKGKVTNYPEKFIEVGVSGLFDMELVNIPLQKDGGFIKTISIINTQDMGFMHDSIGVTLFAQPGDTLEVSWDDKKVTSTFSVRASKPVRQKELELVMALTRSYRLDYTKIYEELYKKNMPDSVKYNLVKQHFASQVKTALTYPMTMNRRKIFCDIYFRHIDMLNSAKILKKYNLSFADVLPKREADSLDISSIHFETIDETLFYHSKEYRDFIFNYTRFFRPFNGFRTLGFDRSNPHPQPNYTLKDCYTGAAAFYMAPKVLDWYLTRSIMFGFGHYSFEGVEEAYNKFCTTIKTPFFRDTLQHFYNNMQRLKPGSAAPGFTLKSTAGKNVSLSDFKNKIVYIDFWGVYCGPCQYEIKNHVPKLYEKYKDKDVVFLNICVDVKEKEWIASCKKLNLHGVNLLAEGWTTHAVCRDYNVRGVPHYVLIDKEGKIVNNNAGRPSELLREPENDIDKLLQ